MTRVDFKKRFTRVFIFVLPLLALLLIGEYIYLEKSVQKNISILFDKAVRNFHTTPIVSNDEILQLTNFERRKNNLSELKKNVKLENAAKLKFADLIRKKYDADKTYISDASYEYEYSGINVAKNYLTPQSVIEGWMKSRIHKENILNSKYTDIGVFVGTGNVDGENTFFVVQIFGSPKKIISSSIVAPVNVLGVTTIPTSLPFPSVTNAPELTVFQVQSYLNSILVVKPSWEEAKNRIDSTDYATLMDSFERQISFCNTIIEHLNKNPQPTTEDLILWQGVTKMGNESSALTTKLFKKLTE